MVPNMNDNMQYVEERLQQWAEWYSRGNLFGLGYPPCSLEYRLMTEGVVVKSTGPRPIACNEEAEEIERFVREIAKQNNKIALALRCQYFGYMGRRKSREHAELLRMSYARFRVYVAMGRQWVAGRLSAPRR